MPLFLSLLLCTPAPEVRACSFSTLLAVLICNKVLFTELEFHEKMPFLKKSFLGNNSFPKEIKH